MSKHKLIPYPVIAAAVRGEHAVAVHHELSPGEAGIGFRAA